MRPSAPALARSVKNSSQLTLTPQRLSQLMHEAQRFLALLAGVGKAYVNVIGQCAAVRVKDLTKHVSAGAPAGKTRSAPGLR